MSFICCMSFFFCGAFREEQVPNEMKGKHYVFLLSFNEDLPFFDLEKNKNVLPMLLRLDAQGNLYNSEGRQLKDDFKTVYNASTRDVFILLHPDEGKLELDTLSKAIDRILAFAPRERNVFIYVRSKGRAIPK